MSLIDDLKKVFDLLHNKEAKDYTEEEWELLERYVPTTIIHKDGIIEHKNFGVTEE